MVSLLSFFLLIALVALSTFYHFSSIDIHFLPFRGYYFWFARSQSSSFVRHPLSIAHFSRRATVLSLRSEPGKMQTKHIFGADYVTRRLCHWTGRLNDLPCLKLSSESTSPWWGGLSLAQFARVVSSRQQIKGFVPVARDQLPINNHCPSNSEQAMTRQLNLLASVWN